MTSEPGAYWTPKRRPLFHYVKLLVSAAQQGNAAEVSWFLRKAPAELSDLQPEAFHCAVFMAVLNSHHSTAEALLQHHNPDKGPLILPICSPGVSKPGATVHPGGLGTCWHGNLFSGLVIWLGFLLRLCVQGAARIVA